MPRLNLTHFGFTPTESLVYEILLTSGPGTGYAIARAAGLARTTAYSALEGLVSKGAARVEGGRHKLYRPEAPAGLIARIAHNHGLALDRLSSDLETLAVPNTPTVVEIESGRATLQLIPHVVARGSQSVLLLVPPDAYPLLAPALRRPVSAGVEVSLWSTGPVELGFVDVGTVSLDHGWPGTPVIAVVDERTAIVGSRQDSEVRGHWSSAPA